MSLGSAWSAKVNSRPARTVTQKNPVLKRQKKKATLSQEGYSFEFVRFRLCPSTVPAQTRSPDTLITANQQDGSAGPAVPGTQCFYTECSPLSLQAQRGQPIPGQGGVLEDICNKMLDKMLDCGAGKPSSLPQSGFSRWHVTVYQYGVYHSW